ncbi:MAG: class I mannose-6-phosphate isomerase [Firmicutes bacterium]|nr:class I mannose-6-phosphate isomerase [Bacillota bacterium]
MQPLKMRPVFKDYLWGGEKLAVQYGKKAEVWPIAESWEISVHPDGESLIQHGMLAGHTLASVFAKYPEWIGEGRRELPVLVKLIDARQNLSLQVHPADDYARREERDSGKNEAWFVLDAAPDSKLLLGLKEPLSKEGLRAAMKSGDIAEKLNLVQPKPGDCYTVPAGMLHSIGAGVLIAEVQQSSNVTYRVHDYGRVGLDGKLRPLHIEKAVDVIDTSLLPRNSAQNPATRRDGYTEKILTDWPYFSMRLMEIESEAAIVTDAVSCHCLLLASGNAELVSPYGNITLSALESAVVPATLGKYRLRGRCEVLLTTFPSAREDRLISGFHALPIQKACFCRPQSDRE